MKKIALSLASTFLFWSAANAQIGNGGIPLSYQENIQSLYTPTQSFPLPNWENAIAQEKEEIKEGISKPYLIGLYVPADFSFPNSGNFSKAENGITIWKSKIQIQNAPAIGFYFNQFHLPKGVQLFITNDNRQQILGAYTSNNNSDDGMFATEAVQGDLVNIELNISSEVELKDIQLNINKILVYFRSISYLAQFTEAQNAGSVTTADPDPYGLEGSSSTCQINANCPEGVNYPKQRKSAVQLIIPIGSSGAGVCSATMINNTGNTSTNCKQYLLTATHCEPSNSTSSASAPLSQMLIRFNFERLQCNGGVAATVNTINGAKYVARANYTQTSQPQINGDFLLLELKHMIPSSWDVYLAGWNKSGGIPTTESSPKKFISFHHPAGDIKKVSTTQSISGNGSAGGSDGPGTHWNVQMTTGGIEQGSSGSALFDGSGRVIGIASVAGLPKNSCSVNGKGQSAMFLQYAAYSKLSYDWNYSIDGIADNRKLKPWLDPANTGVMTVDPIKSTCEETGTGIQLPNGNDLSQSIAIYPNPSSTGIVNVLFNLETSSDFIVQVYNLTGVLQKTFNLKDVKSNSFNFDLSQLANGMYMMKFNNGQATAIKKVTLSR